MTKGELIVLVIIGVVHLIAVVCDQDEDFQDVVVGWLDAFSIL